LYNIAKYEECKDGEGYATQNSTINGQKASAENPIIPKGFKIINTETTTWGVSGVDGGLVIQDKSENEFVWVPVRDLTTFAKVKSTDENGNVNYRGILWGYENQKKVQIGSGSNIQEPANIGEYDTQEKFTEYKAGEYTETMYQEEFNKMVESVKTYGGFYVGRYESSINANKKAASVKNVIPNRWITWYRWYGLQKELYKENSLSSVVSGMIWGCQWDAIMNWMLEDEELEDYVFTQTEKGNYGTEKLIKTGSEDKYRVKNIYDLGGNMFEWTQEGRIGFNRRCVRGGSALKSENWLAYAGSMYNGSYPSGLAAGQYRK